MFNWFKSKKNSIIPSDLDKGFLTSIFCTLKLNTQIDLPKNVVCFVCYKDKIYCEKEQELVIDKKELSSLMKKQHKKPKANTIDMDLYFVNKNEQTREITFNDKIYIGKGLYKVYFKLNLKLAAENAKKFLSFVKIDYALPYAHDVDNLLEAYVTDIVKMFFLRKNLDNLVLNEKLSKALKEKISKFFKSAGMNMLDYSIILSTDENISNKIKIFNSSNTVDNNSSLTTIEENKSKTVDQNEKNSYNEDAKQVEKSDYCPICNCKLIKGSKYCHRCGATIN